MFLQNFGVSSSSDSLVEATKASLFA